MSSHSVPKNLHLRSGIRAGGLATNHSEGLSLRWIILPPDGNPKNHNETLKVASQVKAGKVWPQHNETLQVASRIEAGGIAINRSEALRG